MDLNQSINFLTKELNLLKKKNKKISEIINIIGNTILDNKKVYICGNGGSAADSQHFATEFIVRLRGSVNRKSYPLISLVQDVSTITACANDYSFEKVFSRNLQAFGQKGDLLIVLSTSGKSKNIIKVLKEANKMKISKIGFFGNRGGLALKYCDYGITTNISNTARIQECQKFLLHFILEKVEDNLIKAKF